MTGSVRDHVRAAAPGRFYDLAQWLRIPSIGTDPAYAPEVRRSAEWLAAALRGTGFPVVEIWETGTPAAPGHPAVYAEWPSEDPDAPVALAYGHHDVQPVDPLELWDSPPFEPVVRAEELLARGAADDKGQVLFHLLGLDAHLAAGDRSAPAVTLKFLVEGEEESGSPHFAQLLRDRRDRLRCDVIVVSDTGVWGRDVPTVCTGMRGLADCQLDLHGPDVDLHSGSFGGAVPNPLAALADLLAGLHDAAGRVTLPGFYDRVPDLTDAEREQFGRLPYDEAAWLRTAASRAAAGEAGFSTLERVWARPTAELNGMWGGYTGPGTKTIVPTDAHAKLSFRLVPDQEPGEVLEAFRAYVRDRLPAGITATVTADGPGVRPVRSSWDAPATQAVVRAVSRAFDGAEVLATREGGSGPEADLADLLGAPLVFLGVGLPGDRIHAPNERVVLPMLAKGAEAAAYLWDELATGAGSA